MNARLYLDTRASSGDAPMKIAIAHNGKTAYISLGVRLSPGQWDKKSQTAKKKEVNTFLRSRLSAVELELMRLQALGETNGKSITDIRDMVQCSIDPSFRAKKEEDNLFYSRMERYIQLKDKKKTIKALKWTLMWLSDFDKDIRERTFEEMGHDYLKDFLSHCHKLSINSRAILLRNIRAVFNDAIDAGITSSYPFRRLPIKTEKTKKKALTLSQMKVLRQCNDAWCEEYRDIFLLMFYLRGVNAVDLFSAKRTQVVNNRLEYRRSKVGTLFSIKIEPEAWAIINKYKGKNYLLNILDRYVDYEDYLHHMNAGLKKLGCKRDRLNHPVSDGLFPKLSSNWARHTWGTIGINIGISKEIVSRGMGHSFGVRVTDVYIDYDTKAVDDANRMIIDSLSKSR